MVCALVGVAAVRAGPGGQTLVLWPGSLLARANRAAMMPGVVSVMVARKVACRMGAFQMIWMSNASEQLGLQLGRRGGKVGGDFGQQANQVGRGRPEVSSAGHDPAQPVGPDTQGGGEQVERGAEVVGAQHQPGDVAVGELDRPGPVPASRRDGAGWLLRLHGITSTVLLLLLLPPRRAGAE